MHRVISVAIEYLYSPTIVFPHRSKASRQWTRMTMFGARSFIFTATAMMLHAQFKVVGPAPYTPTVARQKIRSLIDGVDASNSQKTTASLDGLLSWYREIIDEELIAAWKKETRAQVTGLVESLADARVASAIVAFSWREGRQTALRPSYAPLFENLMTRFPESAKPFLDDLLPSSNGEQSPDLGEPEAETACRILLDMPDIGTWRTDALRILPHYRRTVESLLAQDVHGSDQEKAYRALRWQSDLKLDVADGGNDQPVGRRRTLTPATSASRGIPVDHDPPPPPRRSRPSLSSAPGGVTDDNSTESAILLPRQNDNRPQVPNPVPEPQSALTAVQTSPPSTQLPAAAPASSLPPSALPPYSGPRSGTLESTAPLIPQNAEYVFRDLPLVKMQLDYNSKIWDARLVPGEGQTQRLIVRNKSSGPQKRCVVHWSVVP
jgi:hypothetical protein